MKCTVQNIYGEQCKRDEHDYEPHLFPPHVTDDMAEAARQASYDAYMGEWGPKVDMQTARRMVRAALEAM